MVFLVQPALLTVVISSSPSHHTAPRGGKCSYVPTKRHSACGKCRHWQRGICRRLPAPLPWQHPPLRKPQSWSWSASSCSQWHSAQAGSIFLAPPLISLAHSKAPSLAAGALASSFLPRKLISYNNFPSCFLPVFLLTAASLIFSPPFPLAAMPECQQQLQYALTQQK